ncbi:hypothetical protein N7519_004698 [Penicillium mononematosum]|uniref:uncharacterized protein n=1 Tax=Penicillium mononematosum TaxID=268346 RepID=UPI0025481E42|nr:uncharacterized protein N7519_004698 [Penicillium mononematosum]KAJ6189790.1 hypothetical protein N7519_004698 [Penicillium mononematosum]
MPTANPTNPVCPAHCSDPNTWKSQLVGGLCGLAALLMILGVLTWAYWFHAKEARLKHPQRLITEEYLARKKKIKKLAKERNKSSWWHFWSNKDRRNRGEPFKKEERRKLSPRLTILCDSPLAALAELPGCEDLPHVQHADSGTRLEIIALRGGLRLPHQPEDVDRDVLTSVP